jgi:hypothetical protein
VGGTLGKRWAALGHEVRFGVRDAARGPAAVKGVGDWPASATVVAPRDAVRGADVVLLATPWPAVAAALADAGHAEGALDGLTLLDATNPLGPGFQLQHGPDGASGGEQVQALAPRSRVVKVFNTTGYENMAAPIYGGRASMMLLAGDDAAAKGQAAELATGLGFEAVDAGALVMARQLEHVAVLWITLAFGSGKLGRDVAFALLRR